MSVAGVVASQSLADEYLDIVDSLTPVEWQGPSGCPGWRIQDLVAHTGSNFLLLVSPPPPPPDSAPTLTAEQGQEWLVDQRRSWSAEEVKAELVANASGAMDALAAMQTEPIASSPMTLADLGTYPASKLADAFAFDLYCHLRVDLLTPRGSVQRAVAPVTDDDLRPGIGWMLDGLPQMCPKVSAELDQPLGLRLTGPGGGEWTLTPGEDLLTLEEGIGSGLTVVTSTAIDFVLWGTTRTRWADHTTIIGDTDYAARVLAAVNIV